MTDNADGTQEWPATPVERVAQALAEVQRARIHVDAAMLELTQAVLHLVEAATGGHK